MSSRLVVNSVRHTGASADAITMDASGNVTFPANATCSGTASGFGKLLQVVQATKTDTASNSTASGGVWVPTAPKCSITPSNASNKILVQATVNLSVNQDSHGLHLTVLKAGALMFVGDADGNRQRVTTATYSHNQYRSSFLHFNYLDTAGGTSAIEYSLQLSHDSGATQTIYLNRTTSNDNSDDRPLGATSIILSEIAA
tara:strand:- start:44 stop:643 length:600 start_codon:yes stop_codon:yes gene_type:complete